MPAADALPLFRALAPEFGPHGPGRLSKDEVLVMLGIVYPRVLEDLDASATRFNEAVAELAAHKFTMAARIARSLLGFASTGPVASVGVKGFTASHTPAQATADSHGVDELRQTPHGLLYLGLVDKCAIGFGVFC